MYVGGIALEVARYSMGIQTENGIYHSNDFLYWSEGGNYCGGVAVRHYELVYRDPSVVYLVELHRYDPLPGPLRMMESGATILNARHHRCSVLFARQQWMCSPFDSACVKQK